MRFRNCAAAIVGSVLFAAASFAQTATLEGNVIGFDGKPLVGAVIKLHRTDIKQELETKTDKKGHFIRVGIQPGATFKIGVEVDGKEVDSQNAAAHLDNTEPVNFDLQKSAAAKAIANKALAEAVQNGGQITNDMTRGLTDEQKEALEKARKAQEAAIKKNKDRNDAYGAGKTALDNKQYADAIPNFQKAAELDPSQTAIWTDMAEAYMGDASSKTGADRDAEVQKGLDAYGKAIELKPDDAAIHNNYGRALAQAKKFPEAQAEMNKAAQLDPPGAGKYYYNLGAILTNIQQYAPAEEAFKKSIEADPNYADAYYQLGSCLLARATMSADGKVVAVPGTVEAFQKCVSFDTKCSHLQEAKDALTALGSTVSTSYVDPNKPAPKSTTKKK
jgi:tetratricopeptide (TPR) repeat protein